MSEIPETVQIILLIISFIAVVSNIVLLGLLFRNLYSSYKKLRAKFTKGLLTFIGFLLLQQVFFLMGTIIFSTVRDTMKEAPAGGPMLFLNVMELIALIIFYRTTRE